MSITLVLVIVLILLWIISKDSPFGFFEKDDKDDNDDLAI
jgi:hypothetical protein